MFRALLSLSVFGIITSAFLFAGCSDDGDDYFITESNPESPSNVIDASAVSDDFLAELEVESEVMEVTVSSPPVVTFSMNTITGIPIVGIDSFWEDSNRYVRFTFAKLVPGMNGDPDIWVPYTRDADTGEPDYDTGSSLVDNGDGTYTFTFNTDVTNVPDIPYEPELTHRLAGQLGSRSVSLEPQNWFVDFVPDGGALTRTRNITVMETCNQCHDDLVFHGRRFLVQYCVTCHTPALAMGEGNFPFMIHRIHNAGEFTVLDEGISFAELTYPQDVINCRKCHNGMNEATPQGDNWRTVPNLSACFGCHEESEHPGGMPPADNLLCTVCHTVNAIEEVHTTPNATPNNPNLLEGQVNIAYELLDASVNGMTNEITINARILSDGEPLDVGNLPDDLAGPGRFPGFVLAWALPQDGLDEPQDYNNLGRRAAQPISLSLGDFFGEMAVGSHFYDGGSGVNTFVVTDPMSQYPVGATLRAVGLQGYFRQDIEGEIVALHTPSAVVAVTGDDERRQVVDSDKCANCHEWFEGHGGNRVRNMQICLMCHNPNLSSSGRTVTDPTARGLDQDLAAAIADGSLSSTVDPNNPLTYPEDAQSFKSLVHGIHSSGFRADPFQHVRGPGRQGYYDWSHVTFPRGASTSNCSLCHDGETWMLPLPDDLLPTTVRTTSVVDGQDPTGADAENAFVNVPNDTDWIHSPTAGTCVGCHTGQGAIAHMESNGALVSDPTGGLWSNRSMFVANFEACEVCHGPGRVADLEVVHNR